MWLLCFSPPQFIIKARPTGRNKVVRDVFWYTFIEHEHHVHACALFERDTIVMDWHSFVTPDWHRFFCTLISRHSLLPFSPPPHKKGMYYTPLHTSPLSLRYVHVRNGSCPLHGSTTKTRFYYTIAWILQRLTYWVLSLNRFVASLTIQASLSFNQYSNTWLFGTSLDELFLTCLAAGCFVNIVSVCHWEGQVEH